jgi:tetratricopeptide (TPR) repeat protein
MKAAASCLILVALCQPCLAQEGNREGGSGALTIAPAQPTDPSVRAARELDRLFGALRSENLQNAKQIVDKILAAWQQNPSPTAELLLRQANLAMEDGAFDTSERIFNELVGTYPDYTEALGQRAMLYFKKKRFEEALADIEQVLDLEPRHFGAIAGRGMIFAAQGHFTAAKQSLEEAISINPHMESAKAALRQLRREQPDI